MPMYVCTAHGLQMPHASSTHGGMLGGKRGGMGGGDDGGDGGAEGEGGGTLGGKGGGSAGGGRRGWSGGGGEGGGGGPIKIGSETDIEVAIAKPMLSMADGSALWRATISLAVGDSALRPSSTTVNETDPPRISEPMMLIWFPKAVVSAARMSLMP